MDMLIIAEIIGVGILFVFFVFLAYISIFAPNNKGKTYPLLAAVFISAAFLVVFYFGVRLGVTDVGNDIAKDVPLEKVPVKGDVQFSAKIKLEYKNGALRKFYLMPNTTMAESGDKEEK